MRKRCLQAVHQLARKNRGIVFIGSDLGVGVLDEMKRELPGQFLMEGVSEQHIIGMAAGLALSGKTVYINTIATFITRRCFEQTIIDLCLDKLRVRLLGSGGGLVYAPLGPTHMATEDISIMRAIPDMCVIAPADADEMERAVKASEKHPGPIYIRIAKGGEPIVSKPTHGFKIGQAILHRRPGNALLITTGVMLSRALEAARLLEAVNIQAGVLHMHTVKPLDRKALLAAAGRTRAVLTIEENSVVGGLGSAVAEIMAEHPFADPPRFKRLGLPDEFPDRYGSQDSLLKRYALTPESIAGAARRMLAAGRPNARRKTKG